MNAPKFLVSWVITAAAIAVATALISGIHVNGGVIQYLWVAVVFGLINATLGSVAKLVTLPFIIVSLGLFLLVVNAVILEITAALVNSFTIDNFGSALGAALIVSVVSVLLNQTLGRQLTHAR